MSPKIVGLCYSNKKRKGDISAMRVRDPVYLSLPVQCTGVFRCHVKKMGLRSEDDGHVRGRWGVGGEINYPTAYVQRTHVPFL